MPKQPNFFVYMIDTARARNMECYGYHRPTTPNIGKIAENGVLFENHFVNSPWSLPSQTTFMTGKQSCEHGCHVRYQFLEPGIPTLAEVLNRHGYRTAAIQINPWVQQDEGQCMRGFTDFTRPTKPPHIEDPKFKALAPVPPYLPVEGESDTGVCWKMVGWVEDWLERNAKGDQPWFLFVLTGETHMKCWPPRKYREQFLPAGYPDDKAKAIPQDQFMGSAGHVKLTADQWEIVRCLRDGSMAYVDNAIGEIYRNMKKRGLLDDTVFMVTSDHGDSHGEHGFHTAHCQTALWDTMLHTPLVMACPRLLPAGKRIQPLAAGMDVAPTILELAGIEDEEARREFTGKSLLPTLDGKPVHDFVMSEVFTALEPMHLIQGMHPEPDTFDVRVFNRYLKSARTLEWKYIWASDGKDELYRITDDPDEQKNVIHLYPQVAKELFQKMEEYLLGLKQRDFGDQLKHTGHVRVNPVVEKKLAAWGLYRRILPAPPKQENKRKASESFEQFRF